MQAVQAVHDLSVCSGPPGRLLPGCLDKTGHVLTPAGQCSLLSAVSVLQDATVSKYVFDLLTMGAAMETWPEWDAADSETLLSLGQLSDVHDA